MKKRELTVIDVARATLALNRVGREAGVTAIGKMCRVTPERAKRKLKSAIKTGMMYAYKNTYRSSMERTCYALTETGLSVLYVLDEHEKFELWAKEKFGDN